MTVGFYAYNKLFRVSRARVVLIDEGGRIFLVQHWARGESWSIPGGGIERHESAIEAAQRELREELGISLEVNRLLYLTTIEHNYTAPIFTTRIKTEELPPQPHNPREITTVGWFDVDNLPQNMTTIARLALAKLLK